MLIFYKFKKYNLSAFFIVLLIAIFLSCKTHHYREKPAPGKWIGEYNIEILFSEKQFSNPKKDTLGFFRILIDKSQEQRTNIALRSQTRSWRGSLSFDRHLIQLERWELAAKEKSYLRAKNLIQPKPSFIYVKIYPDKLTRISITSSNEGSIYKYLVQYLTE